MKNYLVPALCLAFSFAASAAPKVVNAPVEHVFIPQGFDNNDNVEIFASGSFPNTCYSRNKVEVSVKDDKINVLVTALMNKDKNKKCEDIKVPFLESITIGNLQAGNYDIKVNYFLNEKMNVIEAPSSSVDDHIYALVDYVDLGITGGLGGEVFLVGRTADCVDFDRVEIVSNGKDTISILPIMKITSQSCSKQRVPFNIPVKFNRLMNQRQLLLYVKTMDGKSVNTLIER